MLNNGEKIDITSTQTNTCDVTKIYNIIIQIQWLIFKLVENQVFLLKITERIETDRNKVEMIQIETSKIGTLGITTFCL